MEGDDQVRFCGHCQKSVYNVAQLSEPQAIALIERAEGRPCMKLRRRSDGTIVTADCWVQLRRARKRGLFALVAAAPAIVAAQLWSQGFGLRAFVGLFHPTPAADISAMRGGVALKPAREFEDVPGGVDFDEGIERVAGLGLTGRVPDALSTGTPVKHPRAAPPASPSSSQRRR